MSKRPPRQAKLFTSKRPPIQTKLSFGEKGIEVPEVEEPIFKIGDKVRFNPEYPHMKGIFVVDDILLTWGSPLYMVFKRESEKGTLMSCCTAKALIKVE